MRVTSVKMSHKPRTVSQGSLPEMPVIVVMYVPRQRVKSVVVSGTFKENVLAISTVNSQNLKGHQRTMLECVSQDEITAHLSSQDQSRHAMYMNITEMPLATLWTLGSLNSARNPRVGMVKRESTVEECLNVLETSGERGFLKGLVVMTHITVNMCSSIISSAPAHHQLFSHLAPPLPSTLAPMEMKRSSAMGRRKTCTRSTNVIERSGR